MKKESVEGKERGREGMTGLHVCMLTHPLQAKHSGMPEAEGSHKLKRRWVTLALSGECLSPQRHPDQDSLNVAS